MARYALKTRVEVDTTRREIEHTLTKYGASKFGYYYGDGEAQVMFALKERHIKFLMKVVEKGPEARQRWRALLLCIKAKLESVDCGIESFDDAFMSHVVMPDGKTFGEHARPAMAAALKNGVAPTLLIGYEGKPT